MSIGNLGAVKTLIQGFLASEFNKDANGAPILTQPSNQGASIFVEMIERIASRADLTQSNLKVAIQWFDGSNDVDLSSTPAVLLGAIAMSTATESEDEFVTFYNTTTPTEGTTRYLAGFNVAAGSSAATARMSVVVYPEPVVFDTALSYSVVDNGSDTDIESTSLGTANGVKVMVVYAV